MHGKQQHNSNSLHGFQRLAEVEEGLKAWQTVQSKTPTSVGIHYSEADSEVIRAHVMGFKIERQDAIDVNKCWQWRF